MLCFKLYVSNDYIWFMISADDSEDESDLGDTSEDNDDAEDVFMHSYSDVMNEELKNTTLKKSFLRASEQSSKENLVCLF